MKISKTLNKYIFKLFNYQITRTGFRHISTEQLDTVSKLYTGSIKQIEGYYKEYVDPDYVTNNSRTELLSKLLGTETTEALYIISSLNNTSQVVGDVCEFGVAQGATSALICNEIISGNKNIWFFDSFQGLSVPSEKDVLIHDISNFGSMEKYAGSMASPMSMLLERIKSVSFPKERTRIVAGFIEKTIKKNYLPEKVSFAYVDFDFYDPIKVALEYLDTVLSQGGVILVDDYGFFSDGAQAAVDEFYDSRKGKYELVKVPKYAGHFVILKKIISRKN
ncbi:TylF/MycF family methyltransferase [Flavobacteriaceae bacterium]|nr:TylF/MycF family methyltransferase [Flavobacteriaceae bacterium]